ncbi:MAG: S1 RNA-binding domain-containing protein [Candidatus Latescibacterota bacterium]|nr:S1 RNA-binding domain-containing protein [Candidatus Latescibacterota bacterium]
MTTPSAEPTSELSGEAPSPAEQADAAAADQPMQQILEQSGAPAVSQEATKGDKISGVIVRISKEDAFVDFGGRSEGVIRITELQDDDAKLGYAVGEPIEAFVVQAGDEVRLSRCVKGQDRESDLLYEAYKAAVPVEGKVLAVNKWGLGVDLDGIRAFCPVSQIDTQFVKNPEDYRGQTLQFKIIRFRLRGRSIVLSRRALLEADRENEANEVRARLTAHVDAEGTVTRLESFGAFVDLGSGVEGLIHVSELRHERVAHPKDVVSPGQQLKVRVLGVKNLGDRRKERISLSLKALEEDPWEEVCSQFPAGSVAQGKVESLEDFGAFVELATNVRGMVHVSERAERRVVHPRDVLSIGDEVTVAVMEVDDRRRRLRLSVRRAGQVEGQANLKEFEERQRKEQDESGGNTSMLDALKRAQLID